MSPEVYKKSYANLGSSIDVGIPGSRGDPRMQKPPEGSQQCGDHWMKSIELSYDWKFYTVPFKELLQQGWAKRSYMLDLTSVTMVRITWDRGFADFWVDDVRVYRTKK